MWRWEDEKMRRCKDEKMWRWEDEKMWRWEGVKMRRCEDEKMRRCEDEKMWRWEDVKMRRWEDVKMWWQTFTIRRTLRSDGLGKKWNEGIDMNELKRMNWHEWHESTDMNDLKWRNWNAWIETYEPKRMNWKQWFVDLILKKWSEPLSFFCVCMWNWALATVSCTFCRPHLQRVVRIRQFLMISNISMISMMWSTTWWRCRRQIKWSSRCSRAHTLSTSLSTSSWKSGPSPSVFCDFYVKPSSRYSLVRILSTSSSKVVSRPSVFEDFYVKSSSRYSLVHILSTSSSKSAKKSCQFFTIIWNRALATVSCAFSRPLSGSRRAPAETETLQRRPSDSHFTRKNTGFCARECFQPWIYAFPIAHTSPLLDDDVIDMMMWLTWWCDS